MPITRASGVAGWAHFFNQRKSVSLLTGKPDAGGESFAGASAERVPDQPGDDIRPTRAASAKVRDARQAVGKEPDRTRPGAASPSTDANVQRDRRAECRQIFQDADVGTMPRPRHAAARRTGSLSGAIGPHDPVGALLLDIRQVKQR
jgi:hypothetical protein